MGYWVKGMRDAFFGSLYKIAKKDKRVVLITADTGAICLDRFRGDLNKQYINIGIAEQNMIGVAAGLALSGKIVYVYAIVPFITARCFDQIRIDLCCMGLPVKVVGIGAGFDYSTLGPTHHGTEDIALMRTLPGMTVYSPSDSSAASLFADISYKHKGPTYIRLDREGWPLLYKDKREINVSSGFSLLKKGKDLYIISTGRMSCEALNIARGLSRYSIDAGVIDLFRIKPFEEQGIRSVIKDVGYLVTLEEHFVTGGISGVISEMLSKNNNAPRFKSFGIPDKFCRRYGSREYLQRLNGIDADSVTKAIRKWLGVKRPRP
jgi:transketolase